MHASNGFYSDSACMRGHRRARDNTPNNSEWIPVNVRMQIMVISEQHDSAGHHCHLKTRQGRTNVLLLYNPTASNMALRVVYTIHRPNRRPEGAPPLIALDPSELSYSARERIYIKVKNMLGSKPSKSLRKIPKDERHYSWMDARKL